MKILDMETDKPLNDITVYFTKTEAVTTINYLKNLLESNEHHFHLNDNEFLYQITVAVYDEANIDSFDERSQRLIKEGK